MEIKQSTAFRVPVRLVTAGGASITGVLFSDLTVYLMKQAGTPTEKVLIDGDLIQLDATNMPGHYDLMLSSSNTDTVGFLRYHITGAGAVTYNGLVEIVAKLESDTYALVAAIPTAPALASEWTASRAAKIDYLDTLVSSRAPSLELSASIASISSSIALLPSTAYLSTSIAPLALETTSIDIQNKLVDMYQLVGCDSGNPLIVDAVGGSRTAGSVVQTITNVGGIITVTRV